MTRLLRTIGNLVLFSLALSLLGCELSHQTETVQIPVSEKGVLLREKLAEMQVTTLWLPKSYVDWRTGVVIEPTEQEVIEQRLPFDSHCSAFVASVAERLGVPMLNPETSPYGNSLLANRQYQWLHSAAATAAGWVQVNAQQAQARANEGDLVVASFENPDPREPGHIAIIVPYETTIDKVSYVGPFITQAGSRSPRIRTGNSSLTDTVSGFYYHTHGTLTGIEYFAHAIELSQLQ